MDGNQINSAIELLREVDSFSGGRIKKRDDLHKLYEIILQSGKPDLLEEISFTAKYVNGLMRVLKQGAENPEVDSLDHVKKDLSKNMNKITDLLNEVLTQSGDPAKDYFYTEYLQMTQHSFVNLNDLLSDLEWTKKYLNVQKRQSPN